MALPAAVIAERQRSDGRNPHPSPEFESDGLGGVRPPSLIATTAAGKAGRAGGGGNRGAATPDTQGHPLTGREGARPDVCHVIS